MKINTLIIPLFFLCISGFSQNCKIKVETDDFTGKKIINTASTTILDVANIMKSTKASWWVNAGLFLKMIV